MTTIDAITGVPEQVYKAEEKSLAVEFRERAQTGEFDIVRRYIEMQLEQVKAALVYDNSDVLAGKAQALTELLKEFTSRNINIETGTVRY